MFGRPLFEKFLYSWFIPFSIGVCLSAGYIITNKALLTANKDTNKINQSINPKRSYIQKDYQNLSDQISSNRKNIITENNDEPTSAIETPIIEKVTYGKSNPNKETENAILLKQASSDKLDKIFNELFKTLPKP